ncbi:hypothetical protein C7H19_24460 [Aphanothece hegewaldii CCALA 016]|uniref:Uncharacterized protein n=1 Tax=Aphanothece hegewaldii CCALA 016 TaxID=2107694 RepID=A0A2T1LQY3_9CHRO|nr:hypothetical protein [Aphanothece hegewaldii]PSF29179.1 hypothetical protein C7H19_24460 [Aphanothece hegewaldii CCALA 016]
MKNKIFNVAPTTLSNTIVYQTRRHCNPSTDKERLDSLNFNGFQEQVAKTNYTTAKALQHKDLSLFPSPPNSQKSPPCYGLNRAIADHDFSACLEIAEAISPASDPIEFLNTFNPQFFCPRCKKKAYLFKQEKNHAKVVCLKHGSQLVWTRRVGGQSDD